MAALQTHRTAMRAGSAARGAGARPSAPRVRAARGAGRRSGQAGALQQAPGWAGQQQQRGASQLCRATLDEPEIQELVRELQEMTPEPPAQRPQLDKALALIDAGNAEDPTKVQVDGESVPYRLAYSRWLSEWVLRLDPKASDELLILARGRSIQSWKLADIKRDDYAPNTPGQRQWEVDRKKWLANRLLEAVKEAGYGEETCGLIEDVMLSRSLPDPRDIRKYDLLGPLGMVNFRTLRAVVMLQTLADADALLFLDKNFAEMFNRMPADEVAAVCKRELSRLSQNGIITVLRQRWSPVQQRLLQRALPVPFKWSDIMMDVEGVAAASTHPGDWRYANFDYD
ncbi:hypothetical protein HT031_000074 [Scenedesmus sp. PABB004]|nr:hypothetical protein HT031_000074 [Scenedesmus sp. PABB004]